MSIYTPRTRKIDVPKTSYFSNFKNWTVVEDPTTLRCRAWNARDGHENLAEASGTEKRFAGAPLPRSLKVLEPLSGPTCHANPPRSQKVQSGSTGNANTPRSQKVQSWPTGNANRQPPYWWCLVCRTASRGASSLGCLRKSR